MFNDHLANTLNFTMYLWVITFLCTSEIHPQYVVILINFIHVIHVMGRPFLLWIIWNKMKNSHELEVVFWRNGYLVSLIWSNTLAGKSISFPQVRSRFHNAHLTSIQCCKSIFPDGEKQNKSKSGPRYTGLLTLRSLSSLHTLMFKIKYGYYSKRK